MARARVSRPPAAHREFVARFPGLGEAWRLVGEAGRTGPLDERVVRLIKLGIAAGALREGAVHACVRKAVDAGATPEDIEQVVALTAGTLGFPATVAVHSWTRDILGPVAKARKAKKEKKGKKVRR